jgi:hypothetical protein
MDTPDDDRRDICVNRRNRHAGHCCLGRTMMTAFINKWLRRRRAAETNHYVPFHFTAVTFQRASPEVVNALWTQEIFRQIASGKYFELRSIE